MGQIQISNEFFKKERNSYSNWPFAFWRELIQNSVDAGSSRIDIDINVVDSNQIIVTFNDNGCGFSADIRDNVFFFLGKTNKTQGQIGGFGKARIVVCFSQHNYQIISQDWRCTGSGSSFEVHSFEPYWKGCSVIVNVDTEGLYDSMETYLYNYLRTTQINCDVYVNGLEFSGWCYKRRLAKRLSFGSVYTNKNGKYRGSLLVRVDGVTMFTRYISNSGIQVVLEIDPFKSREILLSNRDSLHQKYQDELDKFIQMLAVDTKSALRNNHKRFFFLQGDPKITRRKRKNNEDRKVIEIIPGVEISKEAAFTRMEPPNAIDTVNTEFVDMNWEIDNLVPSAVVISETQNPKVRRVVSRYNPASWGDGGGNKRKLLRQWAVICDYVVEEYLEIINKDEIFWRPGFVFSDESDAMYTNVQNIACFLLNPVDENGKIIFGLRSKPSWKRMIVRACHEVAHYGEEYHNETFVGISEKLIERTICNDSDIFRSLINVLKLRIK